MTAISDSSEADTNTLDNVFESESTHSTFQTSLLQKIGQYLQVWSWYLNVPFYRSTEIVINCFIIPRDKNDKLIAKIGRIAEFSFTLLFSPISISLHIVGGICMFAGKALAPQPYYYIEGKQTKKIGDKLTLGSWNICSYWGGLPTIFGGCKAARLRWHDIAAKVKEMDLDFFVMQEVSFEAGKKLGDLLQDRYSVYTNIASFNAYRRTLFSSAGPELFIASKVPVLQTRFIPFPAKNDFALKQGMFALETEKCWVFTAHFPDGDSSNPTVQNAHKEILSFVKKEMDECDKPSFLVGDLNIRYEGKETDEYSTLEITKDFVDLYGTLNKEHNETTATCTNQHPLTGKVGKKPFERDDYILSRRKGREKEMEMTSIALQESIQHEYSDHKPIGCEIDFHSKRR